MLRSVCFLIFALALRAEEPPLAAACALYTAGRYAEATAAFERLAVAAPDSAPVAYHLGKLAVHHRDYARAVALLERAAELAPRDAAVVLWLGNAHAWSASVAEGFAARVRHGRRALSLYRRAVELDPESVPARFALMNFYRHVPALLGGGVERAYEQAGEIARRDAEAGAYARALLSFHEKKYDIARETLALLLGRNPRHYGANFLLGRLAVATGAHTGEARAALRLCLQLAPDENDDPRDAAEDLLAALEKPAASRPATAGTR